MRKELKRAVVLGDDRQNLGVVVAQVQERELLHERVAPHEHRADGMRSAVGRAEHDETRARVRAHALPRRLTVSGGEHRAHNQTTHRVRHDADGLISALERVELRVDGFAQCDRAVGERQTPIVGKRHHFMRGRQVAHQVAVAAADERLGAYFRRTGAQPLHAAQREIETIDPHAVAVHGERAAHRARQQEHDRLRNRCPLPVVVFGDRAKG